jgi:hypothetical protein
MNVLQYCHMGNTLTIRLTDELLSWLKEVSRRTGLPMGRIVRQQLENSKAARGDRAFHDLAGKVNGPPDLSTRKGFSRR